MISLLPYPLLPSVPHNPQPTLISTHATIPPPPIIPSPYETTKVLRLVYYKSQDNKKPNHQQP